MGERRWGIVQCNWVGVRCGCSRVTVLLAGGEAWLWVGQVGKRDGAHVVRLLADDGAALALATGVLWRGCLAISSPPDKGCHWHWPVRMGAHAHGRSCKRLNEFLASGGGVAGWVGRGVGACVVASWKEGMCTCCDACG